MDYKPEEVYYESDISCSMSNQMTNCDQSMTNQTTFNLVELIESLGIIGTKEQIRVISFD